MTTPDEGKSLPRERSDEAGWARLPHWGMGYPPVKGNTASLGRGIEVPPHSSTEGDGNGA